MKKQFALRSLTVATALATAALAAPAAHADALTGNIAVVSKYVLRGITTDASGTSESDGAALQAGLTYAMDSGLYVGWWGSSLDYVVTTDPTSTTTGFENDISVGYSMGLGKDMTLDFGGVYYYYIDVDNADVLEPYVNFTFGPVTVGAKVLTDDVIWGNEMDTYLTAAYTQKLPSDFTFKGVLGFYMYEKNGKYLPETAASESSGFRHLDLTLTHPLGKTGLDMSVTYVLGGQDRYGVDQKDTMVLGLSGAF
jgi:uncharacterized protein (TIGR02001 family)